MNTALDGPTHDSTAKLVALLGYPVEHSLSPAMQNAAFAQTGLPWRYLLLPVTPQQFEEQVGRCVREGYAGWNVTVPHKERIADLLYTQSAEVEATGACNTVRLDSGRLAGFNTDPAGFMAGLREAGGISDGSYAVVLGAGGAARAVVWALAEAGHDVLVLARNPEQAATLSRTLQPAGGRVSHDSLSRASLTVALGRASLLVNCTPAGMWPHAAKSPLPAATALPEHLLVYDLVYRPRPTIFLREASAAGCRTQDGLAMLVNQGAASFELWTGQPAPLTTMRKACDELLVVSC